jgi:cyclophilin family peptidyl-prolyl cis-trans isomerase
VRLIQLFIFLSIFISGIAFASNPQVTIKTNLGNITVELYPEKAPKTVENFLAYVADGFYQDTIFHRVIPNFMVQGGGFDKTFTQKPTKSPVDNEASNGLKNQVGTIAMARTSNPHSATAQFFINLSDNTSLDYTGPSQRGFGYTVFGKVIAGMDVINEIAAIPTGPSGPFRSDVPQVMMVIEDIELNSTVDSSDSTD